MRELVFARIERDLTMNEAGLQTLNINTTLGELPALVEQGYKLAHAEDPHNAQVDAIYIYMYACMHVCMHACMHVCMYVGVKQGYKLAHAEDPHNAQVDPIYIYLCVCGVYV